MATWPTVEKQLKVEKTLLESSLICSILKENIKIDQTYIIFIYLFYFPQVGFADKTKYTKCDSINKTIKYIT